MKTPAQLEREAQVHEQVAADALGRQPGTRVERLKAAAELRAEIAFQQLHPRPRQPKQ